MSYVLYLISYILYLMLMTYLMSYVLYLIHLMYLFLMLGRVMLTCDSFSLVGWTSTPKGGFSGQSLVEQAEFETSKFHSQKSTQRHGSSYASGTSKGKGAGSNF